MCERENIFNIFVSDCDICSLSFVWNSRWRCWAVEVFRPAAQ